MSSNSAERIVRRLKRDAPEIAKALACGEFASVRAAALTIDQPYPGHRFATVPLAINSLISKANICSWVLDSVAPGRKGKVRFVSGRG
jgi:hypothetical protein